MNRIMRKRMWIAQQLINNGIRVTPEGFISKADLKKFLAASMPGVATPPTHSSKETKTKP